MGRPATSAGKHVLRDVWTEAPGIVRGEGVAHREAEGSGGGMVGVHWEGLTCLRVHVGPDSFPPEGVVVTIEGFHDSVLVDKGGVGAG